MLHHTLDIIVETCYARSVLVENSSSVRQAKVLAVPLLDLKYSFDFALKRTNVGMPWGKDFV